MKNIICIFLILNCKACAPFWGRSGERLWNSWYGTQQGSGMKWAGNWGMQVRAVFESDSWGSESQLHPKTVKPGTCLWSCLNLSFLMYTTQTIFLSEVVVRGKRAKAGHQYRPETQMILFLLIEDALNNIICPGVWSPYIGEHLWLDTEQVLNKMLPIMSQGAKQMHWYYASF